VAERGRHAGLSKEACGGLGVVGIFRGQPVLDLDYAEDSEAETDMNVVMNDARGFVEVQGTAEGHALQRNELDLLLDLAAVGIEQLLAAQAAVLAK
jgi:ribonuclease PH